MASITADTTLSGALRILPSDSPDAEIVLAHDAGKQAALGRVLVALSALAWSTAGIFTKGVEADVWTVLLWRGLLAGGVMSAWLVWRRGQAGLSDWKHLGWAGWSAATVSSAATICFIAAFKNTAVANVAIIYATAPFAGRRHCVGVDARDARSRHLGRRRALPRRRHCHGGRLDGQSRSDR